MLAAQFPPQQWAAEGLIPHEGLTLLGGKKKLGKSLLCSQLAVQVAAGLPFLGRQTMSGPVLYVCLEDGPERLKRRLQQQGAPEGLPITYLTRLSPLNKGGMRELSACLPRLTPTLVILDTLAACKTASVEENAAGDMADLANALRRFAQEHRVALVLVVHHGKSTRGDAGDDIRGSSALAAAADANLGLYKSEGRCLLQAEGRDIEALELPLELSKQSLTWRTLDETEARRREESDNPILKALADLGESDVQTLARQTHKERSVAQRDLGRLVERNLVARRKSRSVQGKTIYLYRSVLCGQE